MTFDGWDAQLCAVDLSYGQDSLMHFRTKGSKNGVRRYQEEDGTWTPLGLKERRVREGWGERIARRREERRAARAERRAARAAARSENFARAKQYQQEKAEERRKRNPKRLTDAELKKGIERLKMEQEYRELNRSPLLKTGEQIVNAYFNAKAKKAEAEAKRSELVFKDRESAAKLLEAKAKLQSSRNDLINSVTGTKRKEASANYLKAKTERSKNTIRGAMSATVGNIIRKEGSRMVKEMDNSGSIVFRGGRAAGRGIRAGAGAVRRGAGRLVRRMRHRP